MNQLRLIELIHNPHLATAEDYQQLKTMAEQYGYSNALQTIVVYLSRTFEPNGYDAQLHRAAVTITDRSILKKYLEDPSIVASFNHNNELIKESITDQKVEDIHQEVTPPTPLQPEYEPTNDVVPSEPDITPPPIEQETAPTEEKNSSQLFAEVMKNLDHLKSLRKKYHFLEDEHKEWEEKHFPNKEEIKDFSPTHEEPLEQEEETSSIEPSETSDESLTKDAQEETEQAQVYESDEKEEISTSNDEDLNTAQDERNHLVEEESEEPSAKEGNTPFINQDKNEVIELIDKFIEKEPNISRRGRSVQDEESTQPDLSLNSTTISDDLISENLATIFLKQGKKDKAIEIYRKLIWKFPQKKTYFASRIDELKD